MRFKDGANQVIDKMSQRYEVTGPIDAMDKAKLGQVIFYRQPELPPGTYTMETVVYDALAKKASVRFKTIEQTELEPRRVAREQPDAGEPRRESAAGSSVPAATRCLSARPCSIPIWALPLKKGADHELAFFFTAYPGGGTATQLAGTLELLQDAKILARAPMTLPAADTEGRVQQVSRLPIDQLAPGRYQLRVLVQQGSVTVARSTEFRIVS